MFLPTQSSDDRLSMWRAIRQREHESIDDLLAEFKDLAPEQRYIDFYTPSSWPSVFEIVSEGMFCQSGITLVIAATLAEAGFISTGNLRFPVISNHINGNTGLVLEHQNKVFNFTPGKIITLEEMKENGTVYDTHVVPYSNILR